MREASTYRAARRNAAKGFTWPSPKRHYRPRYGNGKTYKPNGERECARRRGDFSRAKIAAQFARCS